MKRLMVAALTLGIIWSGPLMAKDAEVRLEARLTAPAGAGDISGKAAYRDRRNRRQFSVQVEGLAPGEMYDVSVAGVIVGTIAIDAFGFGNLDLDDNFEPGLDDPATRFPSNFPRLDGGELIVVGPLSGTLQPR